MNRKALLEGLLFAVGEEGLSIERIEEIMDISYEELKEVIASLKESYDSDDRGIKLDVLGNRLKLTTKSIHKEYYQKLLEEEETGVLSQAALETLAIIAYNQPITRIDVDEIRGISSSHMIRKLVSRDLIKEVGRSELPGRPILYQTTSEFLDYFGLASKDELPKFDNIVEEVTIDSVDLYDSKYKEEIDDAN